MSDALTAINDFRRARQKADLQAVIARLTGKTSELLSYEEVRKKLKAVESSSRQLKEIPLDAIIGSLGRYNDFNRTFLPLNNSDLSRWTTIKRAMTGLTGVPPIEVYQIDEAYFVKDGNHRVSVAKELGLSSIEAYVTEVQTSIPFSKDISPDELIIKAEYADFLEKTNLHTLKPGLDLSVTVAGKYQILLEHISVHRYFMGIDEKREVSYEEALIHWYDSIYWPVVQLMQTRGLLQDFPSRTETDLYLWLADYRAELERNLGWSLSNETITNKVSKLETPKFLFSDLLVAVSGTDVSWQALNQAIFVAKREQAQLYGLHVVAHSDQVDSEQAQNIKSEFERRCQEEGVFGQLAIEVGEVVANISQRSRWADLVIANLAYPPEKTSFRLSSGFHALLRRTPRPVLAVPGSISPMNKALLAYDGSAKADIALFAASYLASRWPISLGVLVIKERGRTSERTLNKAKTYLNQQKTEAQYFFEEGPVVPTLLNIAKDQQADLLIVGSYEFAPVLEPILGGVLDEVLRQSKTPMLICQ